MIDKARLKQIEDSETIAMLCLRVAHRTKHICFKGCNLYKQLSETLMMCRDHLMGNELPAADVCAINEHLDFLMKRTGVKDMTIAQLQSLAGEEFQPE